MRIRCPHCHLPVEVVDVDESAPVQCPSCGSRWKPVDIGTETVRFSAKRFVGRFQLLEMLGRGRFGEVWSAEDSTLHRQVAIKLPRQEVMDDEDVERFLREARAAAQLRHPHIVGVHEVGMEGRQPFIVSDLIRGVNLADWLSAKRLLPFEEVARLCATLADALHHAHEQGVIHRDFKPSNVLLDEHGEPLLTDFGLAKRDAGEITMTVDGRILGTPAYMSPEQARGDSHQADRRSDVYSLGVMLYEMLTGKRPFRGNSQLLIHQMLHEEPVSPRKHNQKISFDLQTICLKALEKEPHRRYETALQMGQDLRHFLQGEPISARPISVWERTRRWSKRNPKLATAGLAIGFLIAVSGWLVADNLQQRQQLRPIVRRVFLETDPPGARVVFVPIDPLTGEYQPKSRVQMAQKTPIEADLAPGDYFVEVAIEEYGFHEVYRTVPAPEEEISSGRDFHRLWEIKAKGVVKLPAIEIKRDAEATVGMHFINGGTFTMGSSLLQAAPEHQREVEGFYLDEHEVSVKEFQRVMPDDIPVDFQRLDPPVPAQHAMCLVDFDRATAAAERLGKRLPTEAEYEYAATNAGRTQYPWGNAPEPDLDWPIGPVGTPVTDRTDHAPPIVGLFSNVAEWTDSQLNPYPTAIPLPIPKELLQLNALSRVVRGGPFSLLAGKPSEQEVRDGPRLRHAVQKVQTNRNLGFRCARSKTPRFLD